MTAQPSSDIRPAEDAANDSKAGFLNLFSIPVRPIHRRPTDSTLFGTFCLKQPSPKSERRPSHGDLARDSIQSPPPRHGPTNFCRAGRSNTSPRFLSTNDALVIQAHQNSQNPASRAPHSCTVQLPYHYCHRCDQSFETEAVSPVLGFTSYTWI